MTTPQTYRRLFEDNSDGAAVLDDLVRRFSQPQVSAGGIDAVLKTYERGGGTTKGGLHTCNPQATVLTHSWQRLSQY